MTAPATSQAAAQLLETALVRVGGSPDLAAVADLAKWLSDALFDPQRPSAFDLLGDLLTADQESRLTGEAVVLAGAASGHVMVVRHFPAGQPTPIHGHGGWGAVVVLDGRGRYETWLPVSEGRAELGAVCELGPGDTLAWPNPPDDVHRQEGLTGGVTELTIFARHPYHTWAPQFLPAAELPHIPQPRTTSI
jgi:quercetin dioxygenase-like cupin family protein